MCFETVMHAVPFILKRRKSSEIWLLWCTSWKKHTQIIYSRNWVSRPQHSSWESCYCETVQAINCNGQKFACSNLTWFNEPHTISNSLGQLTLPQLLPRWVPSVVCLCPPDFSSLLLVYLVSTSRLEPPNGKFASVLSVIHSKHVTKASKAFFPRLYSPIFMLACPV